MKNIIPFLFVVVIVSGFLNSNTNFQKYPDPGIPGSLTTYSTFQNDPQQDSQIPKKGVEIYRTTMPNAGPSAFAVRFPKAGLSLCYDPVRGGVNYIWFGNFNLKPTVTGKIGDLAIIEGKPFYQETGWHPLRTTSNKGLRAEYHFGGYKVKGDELVFNYTIEHGIKVRERITPIKDQGIRRSFEVENTADTLNSLYLLIETQNQALIAVEEGILKKDRAIFHGKPLSQFAVTIRKEDAL